MVNAFTNTRTVKYTFANQDFYQNGEGQNTPPLLQLPQSVRQMIADYVATGKDVVEAGTHAVRFKRVCILTYLDSHENKHTRIILDFMRKKILGEADFKKIYKKILKESDIQSNESISIEEVMGLMSLESLDCANLALKVVPSQISLISTDLKALDFSHNQITRIPSVLTRFTRLGIFNMSHNHLIKVWHFIPLTRLEVLNVSHNQIKTIPDSLGQSISLKFLDVSSNQIDVIPDSLGWLTNLRLLNVSSNQIDVIPNSFSQLTNLVGLDVSLNPQIAKIPHSLSFLTNLGIFDTTGTKITI